MSVVHRRQDSRQLDDRRRDSRYLDSERQGGNNRYRFKVREFICEGTHAEIFTGREASAGKVVSPGSPLKSKVVALKVLKDIRDDSDDYKKYLQEGSDAVVRALRDLRDGKHPNIIQFIVHFRDSATQRIVYVYEYAEGGDLYNALKHIAPFSEADVKDAIKDTLNGLKYLHDKGIIHRAVEPSNILIKTGQGQRPLKAAIGGFVLAANAESDGQVPYKGRYRYAPFEAYSGRVGPKADMWAIGITLLEAFTGHHPLVASQEENDKKLIHERLYYWKLNFKDTKISRDAQDLLNRLLVVIKEEERPDARTTLSHKWFRSASSDRKFDRVAEPLYPLKLSTPTSPSARQLTPTDLME